MPVPRPARFTGRAKPAPSPRSTDRSAKCFPESIVFVRGQQRVDCDWYFAVPVAGCCFDLREAAPCYCLLQAADILHGTLHTVPHDNVGLAIVSKNVLSTEKARRAISGDLAVLLEDDVVKRARR